MKEKNNFKNSELDFKRYKQLKCCGHMPSINEDKLSRKKNWNVIHVEAEIICLAFKINVIIIIILV